LWLPLAALLAAIVAGAHAAPGLPSEIRDSNTIAAVSSRATEDYVRTRLPDGSYQPETYAFGEGGYFHTPAVDPTIDNLRVKDIARILAGPLAKQNFVPTKDPRQAKLLIMVYWGMTVGSQDQSSGSFIHNDSSNSWGPDNIQAAMTDARNAAILGYDNPGAPGGRTGSLVRGDTPSDLQFNRYFVVLMAYDFQKLWKEKQRKLIWECRFSIRQQGNDFERLLPSMARYASQYFGHDTGGVVSQPLPEGHVKVGVPESIDGDADTADESLIAGPKTFAAASSDSVPDTKSLPPPLASHIESYRRERAALQDALVAVIKGHSPGDDTRRAIDEFNASNSQRIAALNREAESIRGELAKVAAERPQQDGNQSIETLVKQFSENMKGFELRESLYAHP
jgi:hypothetical protein